MKYASIIALVLVTLFSCKQNTAESDPAQQVDPSRLPDTINGSLSEKHERIPGTKMYALLPDSYSFDRVRNRSGKNENTFIQILENPAASFNVAKQSFTRENIEASGQQVDIIRQVKFGAYDAIFLDGPTNLPNSRKTSLIFGDDSFVCLVFGEYPGDSPDDRTEIIQAFASMVYDKDQTPEDLSGPFYDLDLSITGFVPAVINERLAIYNASGELDAEELAATSITITPIPVLPDDAQRLYFEQLIAESAQGLFQVKEGPIKKMNINGRAATVIETLVETDGKTGVFYAAILNGDDAALVFISSAFEDTQNRVNQFKRTLQSVQFK